MYVQASQSLVCESWNVASVESKPSIPSGTTYGDDEAVVELAHGLLGVLPAHGVGFQEFFDLLQREGEDRQLLDLRDEGLDDVVPVEVVRDFAAQVLQGFTEMFRDVVPEARAAGRGPGARAGAAGGAGAG